MYKMSEEVRVRIATIKLLLKELAVVLKGIIDREIPEVRAEYDSAKYLQDKLRKKLPDLTEDEWDIWDKLAKDVPILRDERRKLYEERDGYIDRADRLEDELEELEKEPEFIDVDEETGYLIFYDKLERKYFKVRPDDYREGKVEALKYFDTLEIAVNFTFDTHAQPKYTGQDESTLRLEAEIRITTRVTQAGKRLVGAITNKMRLAFERYITDKFEGSGAAFPWTTTKHIIADGVMVNRDTEAFGVKEEQIRELKEVMSLIIKVGAYYRLSDSVPTMLIDEECAEPEVYGEWVRARDTDYEYKESFIDDFKLEDELYKELAWSRVRHRFSGELGWEQLRRIKGEEE